MKFCVEEVGLTLMCKEGNEFTFFVNWSPNKIDRWLSENVSCKEIPEEIDIMEVQYVLTLDKWGTYQEKIVCESSCGTHFVFIGIGDNQYEAEKSCSE